VPSPDKGRVPPPRRREEAGTARPAAGDTAPSGGDDNRIRQRKYGHVAVPLPKGGDAMGILIGTAVAALVTLVGTTLGTRLVLKAGE
jgi:hypothetical protein